jgi:endonuclease III
MALKKTAGATAGTAKKTAAKGTAKTAAPKKAAGATAKKKAAPKKAAGPKLSEPQSVLLKKVADHGDPAGYVAAKKPENKSLEALLKHKLVKKGKKHTSGNYHYTISKAGQKHLATSPAPASPPKSS